MHAERGIAHDEGVTRRSLLGSAGALVGVGVLLGVRGLLSTTKQVTAKVMSTVLPKPTTPLPALPADPAAQYPGLSTLITPNADFYRVATTFDTPGFDPASWRLKVDGLVQQPLTLSWEQLIARPLIEVDAMLACVSNEVGGSLVGNARWLGVRLDDLIGEAQPSARADQIMGWSSDGFSAGFPLAVLDGRDAIIAIGMNGKPLPPEHGYPARLIVPGLYGYVSATKWLARLELTRFDTAQGYWIPRGWSAMAPIKTASRIDTPKTATTMAAGRRAIAGVAWSPPLGISKVEVQVDRGPWQVATLGPQLARTTWRQWWLPWDATTGDHTITVRATDGEGVTQTRQVHGEVPDGATGWHQISVRVQ